MDLARSKLITTFSSKWKTLDPYCLSFQHEICLMFSPLLWVAPILSGTWSRRTGFQCAGSCMRSGYHCIILLVAMLMSGKLFRLRDEIRWASSCCRVRQNTGFCLVGARDTYNLDETSVTVRAKTSYVWQLWNLGAHQCPIDLDTFQCSREWTKYATGSSNISYQQNIKSNLHHNLTVERFINYS